MILFNLFYISKDREKGYNVTAWFEHDKYRNAVSY